MSWGASGDLLLCQLRQTTASPFIKGEAFASPLGCGWCALRTLFLSDSGLLPRCHEEFPYSVLLQRHFRGTCRAFSFRWCLCRGTQWQDKRKWHQGRFRLDIRWKIFTKRVARHWSRVPKAVLESPSLKMFQRSMQLLLGTMSPTKAPEKREKNLQRCCDSVHLNNLILCRNFQETLESFNSSWYLCKITLEIWQLHFKVNKEDFAVWKIVLTETLAFWQHLGPEWN